MLFSFLIFIFIYTLPIVLAIVLPIELLIELPIEYTIVPVRVLGPLCTCVVHDAVAEEQARLSTRKSSGWLNH